MDVSDWQEVDGYPNRQPLDEVTLCDLRKTSQERGFPAANAASQDVRSVFGGVQILLEAVRQRSLSMRAGSQVSATGPSF